MKQITKSEIHSERGGQERRIQQPGEQLEARNCRNSNESDSPNESGSGSNADPVITCG